MELAMVGLSRMGGIKLSTLAGAIHVYLPYLRFQSELQGTTSLKSSLVNEPRVSFVISFILREGRVPCLKGLNKTEKGV